MAHGELLHRPHVGRPGGRIGLQQPGQHRRQGRRQAGEGRHGTPHRRGRERVAAHLERPAARRRGEHEPQAVDVGAVVDRCGDRTRLLGRGVGELADEARSGRGRSEQGRPVAGTGAPGDAEIDDHRLLEPAVRQQHVVRAQVAVVDAHPMSGGQAAGEPGHQPQRLLGRERPLTHPAGERGPVDEGHDQKDPPALVLEHPLVTDHRVVADAFEGLGLAQEERAQELVLDQFRSDGLDRRHRTGHEETLGAPDLAHAAGPEPLDQFPGAAGEHRTRDQRSRPAARPGSRPRRLLGHARSRRRALAP
ncbi:MAG: hypothetical protein N3D77_06250 [Geminicoccaceae bacterium]|nr:hypothetical protein [Geminicoccaceae bacterium]